eukprot:TRINITY_DN7696_c0_g1_i1.p1 TRINITY_DN7696_c0_g1~~TRINITY_DN7696_c0_g1_i1.p1  ORF type:complete len:406 (-),score=69.36 TRINITY_DN7696_c0_g1_i1:506-1723(-)
MCIRDRRRVHGESEGECRLCNETLTYCKECMNSTFCILCEGTFEVNSSNQCSCPAGTFFGKNEENQDYCQTCYTPLIADLIQGSCTCPDQTFESTEGTSIVCITCQEKFENCNECDSIGCVSLAECNSNQFRTLDEIQCVSYCQVYQTGTFNHLNTKRCKLCYNSCPVCFDEDQNNCLLLELNVDIQEIQNPMSFLVTVSARDSELRRQLLTTSKEGLLSSISTEILSNLLTYLDVDISISNLVLNSQYPTQLSQTTNSPEILININYNLDLPNDDSKMSITLKKKPVTTISSITEAQIDAQLIPMTFFYTNNSNNLQTQLTSLTTCSNSAQCYDVLSKSCLNKQLIVKPELKSTVNADIVNLIMKKENSNTPSNLLDSNTLILHTTFLLNGEKFPYSYEIAQSQ